MRERHAGVLRVPDEGLILIKLSCVLFLFLRRSNEKEIRILEVHGGYLHDVDHRWALAHLDICPRNENGTSMSNINVKDWENQPKVMIRVECLRTQNDKTDRGDYGEVDMPKNHPVMQLFELMPALTKITLEFNKDDYVDSLLYHRPTDSSIVGE